MSETCVGEAESEGPSLGTVCCPPRVRGGMLVYVQVTLYLPDKPAHVAKWLIFHFNENQDVNNLNLLRRWSSFEKVLLNTFMRFKAMDTVLIQHLLASDKG